ncbi:MAG: cardiolipin synthase [Bacteriovoracaceae bacterium]
MFEINYYLIFYASVEVIGILLAMRALLRTRSPEATIAWTISLIMMPFVSIPLYIVFGKKNFYGYVTLRKLSNQKCEEEFVEAKTFIESWKLDEEKQKSVRDIVSLEKLSEMPFIKGNKLKLFSDIQNYYDDLFLEVEKAKKVILVQTFIIHGDSIGDRLANLLIKKASEGLKVYVLFDGFGAHNFPKELMGRLKKSGVEIIPFSIMENRYNRFQLNFRNHRKIVVIDESLAFVGGANISEDYIGNNPKLSPWRDTVVKITGPAAVSFQIPFLEDWYWQTGSTISLDWEISDKVKEDLGDQSCLCLYSGPADQSDTLTNTWLEVINGAKKRVWLATPYFVPNQQLLSALKIAVLKGIEVQILFPEKPDHFYVWCAGQFYLQKLLETGAQVLLYEKGFMHQKVILVDDDISVVGSANFDRRSLDLNFEASVIVYDKDFCLEVSQMMEQDIKNSKVLPRNYYRQKGFLFHFISKFFNLFSPVL